MSDTGVRLAFVDGRRIEPPPPGGDEVDQLLFAAGCQIVKAAEIERAAGRDHRPVLLVANMLLRLRAARKGAGPPMDEQRETLTTPQLAALSEGPPSFDRIEGVLADLRNILLALHHTYAPRFLWRLVDLAGEVADREQRPHITGRDFPTGRGFQITRPGEPWGGAGA